MAPITVAQAQARIRGLVHPLPAQKVDLEGALGRALTAPVTARRTLPPHDNSAMDGYAVCSADFQKLPVTLTVVEKIFAGDTPQQHIAPGTCARIMTGATMPSGADAVVMQEKVVSLDEKHIQGTEPLRAGSNVRLRGEDVREGSSLFSAGHELSVADAGLLWGQGIAQVSVHCRPKVAIVSSGDELCDVDSPVDGKIVDTNSPVIAVLARRAGANPTCLGRAADTLASAREFFARGLQSDVLITLAGASVGERDFTREALVSLGVDIDFWKVAMKPGKPLAFGKCGSTLVFGLPGNPVSAMVTFEIFVRPALRAMQGLPTEPTRLPARVTTPISKPPGLRHFVRARWEVKEGELWATPMSSQSSGALSSASGATCLIDLPEASERVEAGERCELLPVSWA